MNMNPLFKKCRLYPFFLRAACILLLAAAVSGCAHIISKETLNETDKEITFKALIEDPVKYNGKTVILGGVIVKTENKKDGTLLELYQTELNSYGEPVNIDLSEGRFLAMNKGFLDGEIYRAGRKVTVAGIVSGSEIIKLGEIDYTCPYLLVKEMHLWKEDTYERFGPRHPYYREPFWGYPWHPWYYPYWPYTWYERDMYYMQQDTSKTLQKDKGYRIEKDSTKNK